jgi:hypothetical protein
MSSQTLRYIVGIDLGDGESAIAYANVANRYEPEVFETSSGERSIITAVRTMDDMTVYIGTAAFLKNADELHLNFKRDPAALKDREWNVLRNKIRTFIGEFYGQFKEQHPTIATSARVYIGHPSGWSTEGINKYKAIFIDDMPDVEVVAESRCAFIQVRDYHGLEQDPRDPVLVVDIGSSTTDLTFVNELVPYDVPVGSDLGARLIDRLFRDAALEKLKDPDDFRHMLSDTPGANNYLLYLSRRAKEMHFSGIPFEPTAESYRFVTKQCWPILASLSLEEVLQTPIEGFGTTWEQVFRDLLLNAKKNPQLTTSPKAIILTGGGSHMSFTKQICQDVFPDAQIPDPIKNELPYSVCKGLAGYGRWRYKVDAFRNDVNTFLNSSELSEMIEKRTQEFTRTVFPEVVKALYDKVLRLIAQQLRTGELTLAKMNEDAPKYIFGKIDKWLETEDGLHIQKTLSKQAFQPLADEVNRRTAKFCYRYDIPPSALDISLSVTSSDIWKTTDSDKFFVNNLIRIGQLIPIPLRKVVPESVVDFTMDIMAEGGQSPFTPYLNLDSKRMQNLARKLRDQIRTQVTAGAKEVERLL